MYTFSNAGSIALYLISIFGAVIFGYLADKFGKKGVHKLLWVLSFLCLFIPSAFRGYGVDHDSYYYHYSIALERGYGYFAIYKGSPEPLYALLQFVAAHYFGSFQLIYIVSSFIGLGFTYAGFSKMHGKTNLGIAIFWFAMTYYMIFYGLVRICISVGIVTYAFHLIGKKKTFKYFFWCTIATLFHYSAAFMFPMYFVLNVKKKPFGWTNKLQKLSEELPQNKQKKQKLKIKRKIIFTGVVLLGIYFLFPYIFSRFPWYARYIQYFNNDLNFNAIKNFAGYVLLVLLLIFKQNKVKELLPEGEQLLTFFWIMCFVALTLVKFPISRLLYYFMPVGCYLYGYVPKLINKYLKVVLYFIYFAYGIAWWYSAYFMQEAWGNYIVPYTIKFIL